MTDIKGPLLFSHEERMTRAEQIADRFHEKFGADVLAIGLYGSLARGTDGSYSDIEMYCVVQGESIDTSYEWSEGNWKAEVNVYSPDTLLEWASELDEFWSLTHGSLVNILPLHDPEQFFETLKAPVFEHGDEAFEEQITATIMGELYEFIGKIRNTVAKGNTGNLPALAVEMTKYGAYIIGLANRHLYTSSSNLFDESLYLPDRPAGYDSLCELVRSGRLSDPARIAHAADSFWDGLEAWAATHSWHIHTKLEDLLA